MKKLIYIILSLLIIPYGLISFDGLNNDKISVQGERETIGIVYGNKVELNGALSSRLQARLNRAYELYQNNKISRILVSGGVGVEGHDEAIVMKEYLGNLGIDESDIIIDSDGYTTRRTSDNAYLLLGDNVIVIGISQWFHISRLKFSLSQAGFKSVLGNSPRYFELRDFYSLLGELPAFVKYLLDM